MSIPRFSFSCAGSGDVAFGKVWSLAAVVADDLVDFHDDVDRDEELAKRIMRSYARNQTSQATAGTILADMR